MSVSVPGGGGTLIFSYIRRLGPFFGSKILNFNIFFSLFLGGGGFRKMNIFGGLKNIFGVLEIPDILGVDGRCGARAYV